MGDDDEPIVREPVDPMLGPLPRRTVGPAVDDGRTGDAADDGRQVGWHADPFGRFEQRWWTGTGWSEKTRSHDVAGIDPPGIDVAPVAISETEPARPIDDALLPIQRPRIADTVAILVGCLVFLGLIAVFVVAVTA